MATPQSNQDYNPVTKSKEYKSDRLAFLKNKETLLGLKDKIQKGELTIPEYAKIAENYAQTMSEQLKKVGGINKGWSDWARKQLGELSPVIKFAGDNKSEFSKAYTYEDIKLPFTRQEYAQLDASVLPTEQDVNSGLIARDSMPFQRYKNPTGGGTDAQGNPIPVDINLGTDRGAVELEAQRQAGQLQGTLDQQKALRDENRRKLAETLAADRDEAFSRAIPTLSEEANTRGMYRSTGFGELLANKYTDLTRDVQSKLAEAEYGDSEKYVGGLGDIANVRAGFQTSGLQREFGLEDAARSADLARQLAILSRPSESSGKSGGEKWAQGIQTGAEVVSAFKPK